MTPALKFVYRSAVCSFYDLFWHCTSQQSHYETANYLCSAFQLKFHSEASENASRYLFFMSLGEKLLHVSFQLCKHLPNIFFLFFISDYESLRIGGLVFAVALFLLGIFLIVSKYTSLQQMYNTKLKLCYKACRLFFWAQGLMHTSWKVCVGKYQPVAAFQPS